jgi:hypothetical protein
MTPQEFHEKIFNMPCPFEGDPLYGQQATELATAYENLYNVLIEIREFGFKNPGHGYSCYSKATEALGLPPLKREH